jgi:membrane-associated protease RseP (regulator of RpoE activity)
MTFLGFKLTKLDEIVSFIHEEVLGTLDDLLSIPVFIFNFNVLAPLDGGQIFVELFEHIRY